MSANLAGYISTAAVIILCLVVLGTWTGGAEGDLLLVAAALGLVFRIPHTVAVWAGLTLLGTTALALALSNAITADSLANLAYYGLAVGCIWALWNAVAERYRWNMPATVLHENLVRIGVYRVVPPPLLAPAIILIAAAIVATDLMGATGDVIAGLVIVGVLWRSSITLLLFSAATLTLFAILQFLGGYRFPAVTTGLLAAGAFLIVFLQLGWCRMVTRFDRPLSGRVPDDAQEQAPDGGVRHPSADSDRNAVNV